MSRTQLIVAALASITLAPVASGQDTRSFSLKLKDEHGHFVPFYQEMTTEVSQHLTVQGQDLQQRQKSVFWYAWTPVKEVRVREGGEDVVKWTVKQKIEGLMMDIDISGNPIKYDSRLPDTSGSDANPGTIEFFRNLKGWEFTATLGKGYRVEKVEGKEAFIKKLGAGNARMDALVKKAMTDDALKEMVDPTHKVLPDSPRKKGDKWERKSTLNLGPIGTYELIYKFTYVEPDTTGPKKDFDKIEIETVFNYTAPKESDEGLLFKITDGKLTSDPTGSKGVVYYNPKKMWIEEATINLKLQGELTVTIGGTDTKVELMQVQKTVVKTQDTSFVFPKKDVPPSAPTATLVILPCSPCAVVVCERQRRIGLLGRGPLRSRFPSRCR